MALVAVGSTLLASCGDPSTNSSTATTDDNTTVATDPGAMRGVGTPLHGDVKVLDGTELVGDIFPNQQPMSNAPQDTDAWQALLHVTSEPVAVWDRYATALGIDGAAPARSSCVVDRVEPKPTPSDASSTSLVAHQRFLPEPRVDGENQLKCSAVVGGVSMRLLAGVARRCDPPLGTKQTCDLRRVDQLHVRVGPAPGLTGPGVPAGPSQLGTDELRYERGTPPQKLTCTTMADGGSSCSGPTVSGQPNPPTAMAIPPGPVVTPQLDTSNSTSSLPKAGESIDDGLDYYIDYDTSSTGSDRPIFAVPPNGRSLIAPALMGGCNSGLVAVLAMDASPQHVAEYFDRQQPDDDPIETRTGTNPDGSTWLSGEIATAGGYYLDVAVTSSKPNHSDVLVTECGD